VAIFDPNTSFLVIEELENSAHPWLINHLMAACREASKQKQIVLTTHSPVAMNAATPEELWVIWRERGKSKLKPLPELDPDLVALWRDGQIATFDYLDSGAVSQAVPPGPSPELAKAGHKE